jgi:exopolyphosphatase/guanosine-5'-triphosphate,3'-diphosphate pyrophosphatase
MHGELPAFAPHEVELIANVARYHRRAFPRKSHPNLATLSKDERRLIGRLSGILRVADGLDRTHSSAVAQVKPRVLRDHVRLEVLARVAPAVELGDAERKSDLFQRAFASDLEMVWRRQETRAAAPARGPRLHVVAAS